MILKYSFLQGLMIFLEPKLGDNLIDYVSQVVFAKETVLHYL